MVDKVISWLEDILPEVKRTGDPEGVMLKFATEQNLAPALLEKLAQVYNTAKTVRYLEKSAGDARGDSFKVIDADALLRRYVADTPKAATLDSVSEWTGRSMAKAASAGVKVATSFPLATTGALDAPLWEEPKRASAREILRERDIEQINAEHYRQVCFDLQESISEQTRKLAEKIRSTPDYDFAAIEADALHATESQVKDACARVAGYLQAKQLPAKRANDAGARRLVRDEHGFIRNFVALQDTLELLKAATSLADQYTVKDAALLSLPRQPAGTTSNSAGGSEGLARQPAGKPQQKIDDGKEGDGGNGGGGGSTEKKPSGGGIAGLINSINIPKSPLQPGRMITSLVQEALPTRNTGQEQVDRDFEDTQSKVVVERLMMTDPILSEANPHIVTSLANSIREQSPGIARDINAMRFALREAVQYNALPTHTVKDLAGVEDTKAKTEQTQRGLDREQYSQGFKPKKAA